MEWIYTVDPYAPVPIMLINDDIGVDPTTGKGIDGSRFQAELMALDALGPKSIEVWINSIGGNVDDGYNINSAILLSKTPVDTVGVGIVASIMAVIFQSGRKRILMDYAWLMYHNPIGGDNKKVLDMMKTSLARMTARSGCSEEDILAMMKKETFIDAPDALKQGLCDEVRSSSDHNKKRLVFSGQSADVSSFSQSAKLVVNKLLDNPKNKSMSLKLVTNKLGLNEDATEDNILKAIDKIQNKAKSDMDEAEDRVKKAQDALKEATDALNLMKTEKDSMEKTCNKLTAEKTDITSKLDTLQKEKEVAEEATLTLKCKNMVEGYAKVGRIQNKAEVITFWTELAKTDFDLVKNQIEALPLNKTAPVITNIEPEAGAGTGKKYTFGVAMVEIKNKLELQKTHQIN